MTKAQIARRVSWATQLSMTQCLKMIDCLLEAITASVADGHRVHFRKFGSFYPREKAERIGRNPKTGESVMITARRIPCFKPSAVLKGVVNK